MGAFPQSKTQLPATDATLDAPDGTLAKAMERSSRIPAEDRLRASGDMLTQRKHTYEFLSKLSDGGNFVAKGLPSKINFNENTNEKEED